MLVAPEVVLRARTGEEAAFTEIVLAYRKRVLATVARLILRSEDVEDVSQEVFTRLYFSLDQLRSAEGFEAWLYRLTMNAAYDYLRRQKRRPEHRMADLSEQQVTIADALRGSRVERERQDAAARREALEQALAGVSEEDRVLLTLKEVEGLSLKELEAVYHVNGNALKVRLFRARQRVLKALGHPGKHAAGGTLVRE